MYNHYMNEKDSRGFSNKIFEQQIDMAGVSLETRKELLNRIAKANEPSKKEKFEAKYKAKVPELKKEQDTDEEKTAEEVGKTVKKVMSEGKEPAED